MSLEMDETTRRYVEKLFRSLDQKVSIHFFVNTRQLCEYCDLTEDMLRILQQMSHRISFVKHDLAFQEAGSYEIVNYPALVIHGREEYGVRFFGLPRGYEFAVFVKDIVDASTGESHLAPRLAQFLGNVQDPVNVKVFVSPTCPYCRVSARAAHRFAIANRRIIADVVESTQFPELVERYRVQAVPKTVINEKVSFEGAVSDAFFLGKILEALQRPLPEDLSLLIEKGGAVVGLTEFSL